MDARSTWNRLAGLALLALLLVAGSSLLGPNRLGWSELSAIYWQYRAPRTALAAVAGAGLAVGGVIFQALFRNPLAEPYTLGIASGAALGAAIAFIFRIGGCVLGAPRLELLALCGALTAMLLVMSVGRARAGRDMTRLLLAGVCVAYLCGAGVLLVTYLADETVTNDIVIWMMGSLALYQPRAPYEVLAVLVPVLAYGLYAHRALDLLAMGDHLAASRGVNVGIVGHVSFVLVGILTAVIVAKCGPIGFVGLMVPHITRRLVGENSLPLLLGSAVVGAALLAVCDALARSITSYELPVGILTNIAGAGFFFFILVTRDVVPGGAR